MADQLVPASIEDRAWLERLRRYVYQDLFKATFGKWDEAPARATIRGLLGARWDLDY